MKIFFISFILTISAWCSFSQDKIIRKNGDTILAKVEAINANTISYKKFFNLNGPLYSLETSQVSQIIYENNTSELFSKPEDAKTNPKNENTRYGNNIVSLQPVNVFASKNKTYLCGGAYVERLLVKGYLGIKLGAYIAFDLTTAAISYEAKFYPTGQGKFKYYIGAGGKSGLFYFNTIQEQDGDAMNAFQLINGFHYQISKHFLIGLDTGIGMGFQHTKVYSMYDYKMEQVPFTAYSAGLLLGVRF